MDIIREYAKAYSTILENQSWCSGHFYIDAFAGAGIHISRATGEFIPGSPLNAVTTRPPFTHYFLIDLDSAKTDHLRELTKEFGNVTVFDGDCNQVLMAEVFPRLLADKFCRALCILDPYGLHLNWNVIKTAGQSGRIEIFLNFPVADINRNALWNQPDKVKLDQAARLTAFWGDETWRTVAYDTKMDLFGHPTKTDNDTIAEAFRKRLVDVAGFKYVPQPIPMRNRSNAVVYYLFFGSPNATGERIVKHIFKKYKDRRS
ncbi:MAG: three-Cys-motif partner protein TcmP [Verrucomicrobia bacterium]|nr:three-Cys-motif partner protein TcmP [Verrucomicrobiota bacterium]